MALKHFVAGDQGLVLTLRALELGADVVLVRLKFVALSLSGTQMRSEALVFAGESIELASALVKALL